MRFRGGTLALCALSLNMGGCDGGRPAGTHDRSQPIAPLPAPVTSPAEASARDTVVAIAMRNVLFRIDDETRLHVHRLQGHVRDLTGRHIVALDDPAHMELDITLGEIGLTADDLTRLLNRYAFGYPGAPLRHLKVRIQGDHIVQTGSLHKVVNLRFRISAQLGVSNDGRIRAHPTDIRILGIDSDGLLRRLGLHLASLVDLRHAPGASLDGNDILLDPTQFLPPPVLHGRLTEVRIEGDEVLQVFGAPDAPAVPDPPLPVAARNYVLLRGGTLRFGKLYMVQAELQAIDADPADGFDFYLKRYHLQLTAGYHTTLPDYGLVAVVPDWDDLGTLRGQPLPAAVAAGKAHPHRARH